MTTSHDLYIQKSKTIEEQIRLCLAKIKCESHEKEDLKQIGRIAVFKSLKNCHNTENTFNQYVYKVIQHAFITYFEKKYRKKRHPEGGFIRNCELEYPCFVRQKIFSYIDTSQEEEKIIAEQAKAISDAIKRTRNVLDETERNIIDCYLNPTPRFAELIEKRLEKGRKKSITNQMVYNHLGLSAYRYRVAIERIKRKFLKSLNNDLCY